MNLESDGNQLDCIRVCLRRRDAWDSLATFAALYAQTQYAGAPWQVVQSTSENGKLPACDLAT